MFKTAYVDSIREYIPEAAKAILDEQLPKIRQQIADDVAAFGAELRAHLEQEVKAVVESATKEAKAEAGKIQGLLDALTLPPALHVARDNLKVALDDFTARWSGLGEKVGAAVKTAATKALAL